MATSVQILILISLCLTVIAFLLNCIAFATPNWLVSNGNSPFKKIGFFIACFDMCNAPYCPVADDEFHLDGCYSLWSQFQFDYYVEQMWYWITPDWFTTCRIFVILLIPILFITAMALATATLISCKHETLDKEHNKHSYYMFMIVLAISAVLLAYSGFSAIACVAIFYTGAFRNDWMPYRYKNHLDYSFWMEVVVAIFLMVAFFMTLWAIMLKCFKNENDYKYSPYSSVSEQPESSQRRTVAM